MATPGPYQVNPLGQPTSTQTMGLRSGFGLRSGEGPEVGSSTTRLLISISTLMESLTKWSEQRITDMDVCDAYTELGNNFNTVLAAFAAHNIEMKDLYSVPEDLRRVLETCLIEDPRPGNLQPYLPDLRKVITNLLQGLRSKQAIYRGVVSGPRYRSRKGLHQNNPDASRISGPPTRRTITSSRQNPPSMALILCRAHLQS